MKADRDTNFALQLELIELTLSAIGKPEGWKRLLSRLLQVVSASTGAIQYFDHLSLRTRVPVALGVSEAAHRSYTEQYGSKNVWMIHGQYRDRSGMILTNSDLYPDEELVNTEFYRGFLEPNNLFYSMRLFLHGDWERSTTLTFLRSRAAGPFSPAEKQILQSLSPQLLTALRLESELEEATTTAALRQKALDYLSLGFLLIDDHGRLLAANRIANMILEREDGLAIRNGRVFCTVPQENCPLLELVRAVTGGSDSNPSRSGGTTRLLKKGQAEPLLAWVVPLPQTPVLFSVHSNVAAVFLTDPQAANPPVEKWLEAAFTLSPAEARLAGKLALGLDLTAAALSLGITINTARSHLKRVFRKTNTSRQSELIRLLSNAPLGPQ